MMPQEESDSKKSARPDDRVYERIELVESDASQLLPEVLQAHEPVAAEHSVSAVRKASQEAALKPDPEVGLQAGSPVGLEELRDASRGRSTDVSSDRDRNASGDQSRKRQPGSGFSADNEQPRLPTSAWCWVGILLSIPVLLLSSRGDSQLFSFAPVIWLSPHGDSQPFLLALFLVSVYWSVCIYKVFANLDSRSAEQIPPWRAAMFSMGASPSGIAGLMLLLDVAIAYCTQAALNVCKFLQGTWLFDAVSTIIFIVGIFLLVLPFVLTYRWYFLVAQRALLPARGDGRELSRRSTLFVSGAIATAIAGPNMLEILLFLITRHDYSTTLPMNYLYGAGMMLAFVVAMMAMKKVKRRD
jgi:hypothetical protein